MELSLCVGLTTSENIIRMELRDIGSTSSMLKVEVVFKVFLCVLEKFILFL